MGVFLEKQSTLKGGPMTSRENELSKIFGDSLSHNVELGIYILILTGPLHIYWGFWFYDLMVFLYM